MITYHVIGKRPGLLPEVETVCDEWLGMILGEIAFAVALTVMPDGLVIEVCADGVTRYAETSRMRLSGIDPEAPGEMCTERRAERVEVTKAELKAERLNACLLFRDWSASNAGDRLDLIRYAEAFASRAQRAPAYR
jgi:hypothetical protein